jgi:DNA processing protein
VHGELKAARAAKAQLVF